MIVIGGGWVLSAHSKPNLPSFVVAQKADILEIVSVTGAVKPVEAVDLAFERGGKLVQVNVKVGDAVSSGQILASLNNADLAAQLAQTQANFEAEQANLSGLEKGTRPEELSIANAEVVNAANAVRDAESALSDAQAKAEVDLANTENTAITAALKSVTVGKNAVLTLTDIQFAHFAGMTDQQDFVIERAKADAVYQLLGAADAGHWTNTLLSILASGAYGQVQAAINDSNQEEIESAVDQAISALSKVAYALDQIPVSYLVTATEKTNLSTEKTNVNTEITTLSAKQQAVALQKVVNGANLTAAQTNLNNAKSALNSAMAEWQLKKAGSTPEQIAAQEAQVKALLAQVQGAQAELAKTIIRAPLAGIVTKKEGEVGEIIPANKSVISVIRDAQFQIETYVPEADIVKVKVNDSAKVTLDAYSNDVIFEAKVVTIDPAETVIEGVSTYKVTLEFIHLDPRIRSGMTANLDIETDKKEQVLSIPQRAIETQNGKKFVKILEEGSVIKDQEIQAGLRGFDGNVEILEGLKEGDKVII